MPAILPDVGEEFERRLLFEQSIARPDVLWVGLYHDGDLSGDLDAGDDIRDGDDIDAITTEPSDGNYTRQSIPFGSSGFSVDVDPDGNWYGTADDYVNFDTIDTTGTVDAYFVAAEWDRTGSGAAEMHLYWTALLDEVWELDSEPELELATVGLAID